MPSDQQSTRRRAVLHESRPAACATGDFTGQFRNAIMASGLNPPEVIVADGKLRRYSSNGKPGDDAAWYVMHSDGIPAGAYGCWRTGISQTWRADIGRSLTPSEESAQKARIEAAQRAREADEAQRHAEAKASAAKIWQSAVAASASHAYLTVKAVPPLGIRMYSGPRLVIREMDCDGALIVPLCDSDGELHSLQFIAGPGESNKRYFPGGRVRGCYFGIGSRPKDGEILAIAEGYATAASVHRATGCAAVVAFDAGNLAPVAAAMRGKYPNADIVICADNDFTVGIEKAREAARAIGGMVAVPEMDGGKCDFNDLAQAKGLEAVKRVIEAARAQHAQPPTAPQKTAAASEPAPDLGLPALSPETVDPTAPLQTARLYIAARSGDDKLADLAFWQSEFWAARGTHYDLLPMDALKAALYNWLEHQRNAADGKWIKPNKRLVESLIDALKAAAHVGDVVDVPAWLGEKAGDPDPSEIIACRNGLLHVPTRSLMPATRRFFNLNALNFDYVPDAPEPANWVAFLRDLWADDHEAIDTLQEIFGLALTSDTRHQKAFLIVGPRRSGKGTIARVLQSLIGIGNVTAPMLASIGQQFGLESMLGKTLALVSDARLGGRADLAAIVENLLRITGEDAVSVPRKFKTDWTARLRVRFVILSNELPAFLDQSGALSGRFIVLRLTRSFYGQEDLALTQRLLEEMPGILVWALAGLDRLRERGHFRQPASALEMVRQLETLSSPIKSFVSERCIVAAGASIEIGRLFDSWVEWTRQQGRAHAGTSAMFGKDLSAAFPEIGVTRPRINGSRDRHYSGIRLRDITDPDHD